MRQVGKELQNKVILITGAAKAPESIVALAAVTIDGKIARRAGQVSNWTSPEDKAILHKHLDKADVVILGRKTYKLVKSRLKTRTCLVFTRSVRGFIKKGSKLFYCNADQIDLRSILRQYKWCRVCVLGGTEVYNWFLQKRLISDIYLTIEPIIFGHGLPLFNQMVFGQKWKFRSVKKLNTQGSLLLHYQKS